MLTILRFLASAAALAVATFVLNGITLDGATSERKIVVLLGVALIFGLVNAAIKPIFKLVTLPLVLLSLGLFLLVINALLLMLTSWLAGMFGLGWQVDGFWTALLGSVIVSVVSFVIGIFLPRKDRKRRA